MEGRVGGAPGEALRAPGARLLADAMLAPLLDAVAAGGDEVPPAEVALEIRQLLARTLGPRLPHVAAAVAAGALGANAVFILEEALVRLRPLADPSEAAEVEQLLVREARRLPLRELAETAAGILVDFGAPVPEPATSNDAIRALDVTPDATSVSEDPTAPSRPDHGLESWEAYRSGVSGPETGFEHHVASRPQSPIEEPVGTSGAPRSPMAPAARAPPPDRRGDAVALT